MIINTRTPCPTTANVDTWMDWAHRNYEASYAAQTLVECYSKEELQDKLNEGLAGFSSYLEALDDVHADINNA